MARCPKCSKENREGARFCDSCGAALVEPPAAPALEERKVVSVLFCDLVGFTARSESDDPEDVRARIRPYHARLRQEIERYGGTVEKFIGDAVMAVFGAPVAHEDDAERAVRAGLRILEAIQELNETDASPDLQVRVGINTGETVVALEARPEQGEGIVTGDVVNTAARLQTVAPVNGIAVGEQTYRRTKEFFDYDELDAVAVRGKSDPVPLWHAKAARSRFGTDIIRRHTTSLVGRELEKSLLTGTFERSLQQRSVQLVTIVGEPGVGKSRLVAELFEYVDAKPELTRWREGRCLPYGEGITFWALGEIVKAEAGILESDSAEVAAAKLAAAVSPEESPWLLQRLAPLVGAESTSSAERKELFTAWRRFLEGLAGDRPTVLVFEDLHWADDAMLAFLEHLADWAQGVPLLVVCSARPELYERNATWGAGLANHTAISLSPLSNEETARLVSARLEWAVLPAEMQQLLLERAGGNPLYAEEFVRMLRDRGLLGPSGIVAPGAELPFPDSLQALIAARLDTLPQERKRLLQDAAVIGKVFWAGSVAALGERDPREVEQALHELGRKELVRPARRSSMEGEAEYGFWHLLVRDVAYAQIPRAERAVKHARAAEWLEQKAGERVEDLAEVLAFHTGEAFALAQASGDGNLSAELQPAAGRYAFLAGERALGLDTGKALTLLERARTLTAESDVAFPLVLLRWADAARQAGRLHEAATALEQAIAAFLARKEVQHTGEALATLASVRGYLGERGNLAIPEEAVAMLERQPGPQLVEALAGLAGAHYVAGAFRPAIAAADRALGVASQQGLALPGRALGFRGVARCYLGDLDGLADMEQALSLLVGEGKGRDAAVLQNNLAFVRWFLEGPAAALAQFEQGEAFATARGLTELAQLVATGRCGVLLELGRLDEALSQTQRLAPALRESGNLISLCELRASQARALAEQGRNARAEAEEALKLARDSQDRLLLAFAGAAAAPALLAAGSSATARALIDEIAAADNHQNPEYGLLLPTLTRAAAQAGEPDLVARLADDVPDTLPIQQHALCASRAHVAEHAGEFAEAAALYAEAAGRWQQFGNVPERAYSLLGEGRCLLALGRPSADVPLRQARKLFASMGYRPTLAEAEALLEQTAAPAS